MRAKGLLVVTILMGCVAGVQAEHHRCKDVDYSRWHYWAPALVKLKLLRAGSPFNGYASPGCPEVPAPIEVIRHPCPAVLPQDRYLGSGLPYDPAGPFLNQVPPRRAVQTTETKSATYPTK